CGALRFQTRSPTASTTRRKKPMTEKAQQQPKPGVLAETDEPTNAKSAILYSQTEPSPDHEKITTSEGHAPLYIRVEVVEGDVGHALDVANPRDDEILLNTVPI